MKRTGISVLAISVFLLFLFTPAAMQADEVENKINSTYWSAWGSNTSYNVGGRQITSNPVDMDRIEPCYNVIIVAFIVTDNDGNYVLSLKDPGSQGEPYYSEERIKDMVEKTKAQNRKVIVSLGGQYFNLKMKTEDDVAAFVLQTKEIVDKYGFEGIDLDLETDSLGSIDPVLMGKAVMEVVDSYRKSGVDFWLTAAPEWCYIVPYMYGSGQWASHSLAGEFYVKLGKAVGIDNFSYIWPQLYNQGPANGVAGPQKDSGGWATKVVPTDGMDKFISAFAWAASSEEGFEANGEIGLFVPAEKLVMGIPATEGAAGGEMTYIATPELILSGWEMMKENEDHIAGFMNWSVDWDALNIKDGDLSPGYSHAPWATGLAVSRALELDPVQ